MKNFLLTDVDKMLLQDKLENGTAVWHAYWQHQHTGCTWH